MSGEHTPPQHSLRSRLLLLSGATFLLCAAEGEAVSLRLRHQRVGRYEGRPLPVRVLDPAGKEAARVTVPLGQEAACTFTAGRTGTFRIECAPKQHTVGIAASSHPVCIAGQRGEVHLLGTTGDFYFWVPASTRHFGLRFQGEGEGERLTAAVFDAAGRKRWEQADIAMSKSFRLQRDAASQGEVWRLHVSRPGVGVLEDCHVELRGLPPVLGFSAEDLLRPAPR